MHKFSADKIYIGDGTEVEGIVIVTDDNGAILEISNAQDHDPASVQFVDGAISPGFVNTHCHLELSHMKGLVDTGTGLLPFLQSVVKYRDFAQEVIDEAIVRADQEMYDNGIVAVGDISNTAHTADVKSKSKLRYYTFVEMFDFMQSSMTAGAIEQYSAAHVQHADDHHNSKSYVPHAPYTVSEGLYAYIRDNNVRGSTVSIHNQETPHEDALFQSKSGGFLPFYDSFGMDLAHFEATGKSSIHTALTHLDPRDRNLFVHNTCTTADDIAAAHTWSDNVYWATCPNANLYIENSLPDYQVFLDADARMTIGTDSLTSNWQLSVFEEIKTIKKYKSYVPLSTLIKWACSNGAEALGFDNLGSIQVGKTPGLLHWSGDHTLDKEVDLSAVFIHRLI